MAERNTYFHDEIVKEKFNARQLIRVLKYALPHKKVFLFIFGLMLVSVAISLIAPLLIRDIVDNVVPNEDSRRMVLVISGLAFVGVLDIAITFFHQRLMSKTGHRIIATIRRDIFANLQRLPFDFFDSRPAGKIVVRVTSYVDELANFFANILLTFIVNILRILMVTVFMLALNLTLTLIVLSAMIPLSIGVYILRHFLRKLFRISRAKDSNRTAYIVESIMGVNVVKSFNRSERNTEIYGGIQQEAVKNWFRIVAVNELNLPVIEILWYYGTLMLYGVSFGLILSGALQTGTVIAFLSYMGMFNGPLTQMASIFQQMAQVSSNLERIFETIDTPSAIQSPRDAKLLENPQGRIDFEDVTFAYEEDLNVLEHFTLHVEPGQTIALVGPTGAGKATVINLLTRFYDVKEGSVKIDGLDVRELDLHSLRTSVGVLMQDSFIFKGTIMENIRYGRPDATDAECMEAARRICAEEFILKQPQGYYTQLAERGEGLSAGQRQLLSFARIMLKDPSVLILDEATSSIDSETEEKIQTALNVVLKGRTSFLVAHRLSTIRQADRILYIANKGIAESGTHEELMKKKGLYYDLCTKK